MINEYPGKMNGLLMATVRPLKIRSSRAAPYPPPPPTYARPAQAYQYQSASRRPQIHKICLFKMDVDVWEDLHYTANYDSYPITDLP